MEFTYYIEYLNKNKGYLVDRVSFTGPQAHEDCVRWGQKNLDNFNLDMVKIEIIEPLKEG